VPKTQGAAEGALARGLWWFWRPLWGRRELLGGWAVHAATAAIFTAAGWLYLVVAELAMYRGVTVWSPSTWLDHEIPVLPWSIFVYESFYAYFVLALLVCPRNEEGQRELLVLLQGLAIVNLSTMVVFVLLPCEVVLVADARAALGSMHPLPRHLFELLYAVDRPYNSWPSLHASLSLVVVLFLNRRFASRALTGIAWAAWGLMMVSILTTKQHYLFDLVSGVLLAGAVWRLHLAPRLGEPDQSA